VEQIVAQSHELPLDDEMGNLQQTHPQKNEQCLPDNLKEVKNALPRKTNRAAELAAEKVISHWLTVIPAKDMNFTLNKREFRDAIHLRYDWNNNDIPSLWVCGDTFDVDHAMVCRRSGFVIQRHNDYVILRLTC